MLMLLIGLAFLGIGVVLLVVAIKAIAAGESGDIVVRNNQTGQQATVGRSKAVPVIGAIIAGAAAIGGAIMVVMGIIELAG